MDQEHVSMPSATDSAANLTASGKCILLVEDDRSVRRYLEVTLQRWGYRVLTASDGLEAMKVAMTAAVDVVVTDAVMPHMSGHELARFLRGNAKLSNLPIVLLTGQENQQVGAGAETIDAFLYKPVKAQDLKNCLTKLLS
jgi:chemosensory pili system protein ChpA (sensor histidine kinase/response regulator)